MVKVGGACIPDRAVFGNTSARHVNLSIQFIEDEVKINKFVVPLVFVLLYFCSLEEKWRKRKGVEGLFPLRTYSSC